MPKLTIHISEQQEAKIIECFENGGGFTISIPESYDERRDGLFIFEGRVMPHRVSRIVFDMVPVQPIKPL